MHLAIRLSFSFSDIYLNPRFLIIKLKAFFSFAFIGSPVRNQRIYTYYRRQSKPFVWGEFFPPFGELTLTGFSQFEV